MQVCVGGVAGLVAALASAVLDETRTAAFGYGVRHAASGRRTVRSPLSSLRDFRDGRHLASSACRAR